MWMAFARYKNNPSGNWSAVTNAGQPFLANEGLLDWMIELMEVKYPDIDYQKRKLQ